MTDGRSGQLVDDAAAAVHSFNYTILVYVIGVTDSTRQEELEVIATAPEFITHLDSFDQAELVATQEARAYEICFTGT